MRPGSLKQIFHYHFINAQAPIPEVQANIVQELEYQSSLELDPRTFDRLRGLPLASQIVRYAPQDLVRRFGRLRGRAARNLRAGDRVH
jgi:adenylate kinase